ncbi:ABC transporter permease [Desulfurella sp.]|uniref:ABC transporter permease n=2 Tax=Desulfurella sp. TaxID=1962857 RepID=UPI003D14EDDE
MINRIFRLIIKEFLVIWVDPYSRSILIIPPLLQLLIFSFAATHDVKNVSLGIYTEDLSKPAIDLISYFQGDSKTFTKIKYYSNLKEAEKALIDQKILAVIHIGANFSKDVLSKRNATIQVLLDGRKTNASLIVDGYINSIVKKFSDSISINTKDIQNVSSKITYRMWFNPNLNPMWSSVPALVGILINLVTILITALTIARERELGTFDQLLVSPIKSSEILIGKAIPAIVIGFFEGILMVLMGRYIFGLPFEGSVFILFFAMFLFLIAIVGVGLFISSLSKTQQQGFLGGFSYIVPMVLLSGFATPIENIPSTMRWVAYINPLQYMVTISRAIFLENPSLKIVFVTIWPLLPISFFTMAMAVVLFKKKTG